MAAAGKTEFSLKLFKIINYRNEANPSILDYRKIDDADEKKMFNEELSLLILKYKRLKLKVNERVPAWSRVEGHVWYITKDKYGVLYFIVVKEAFEEKYVFKLQGKIRGIIDYFYDDLNSLDERKANEIKTQIEEKVEAFNNALSRDAPAEELIASENSEWKPVSQEEVFCNLDGPDPAEISVDKNDYFYQIDRRNFKVKLLQFTVMGAAFFSLMLGVLDFMVKAPKVL